MMKMKMMMNMMMKMMMMMCFDQTGTIFSSKYDEHDDQTGTNLSSEYDEHDVENDDGALLPTGNAEVMITAADAGDDANCW